VPLGPADGLECFGSAFPTAVLISEKNGLKSGALPSLTIGTNGATMFMWISNCAGRDKKDIDFFGCGLHHTVAKTTKTFWHAPAVGYETRLSRSRP
jgi:hypothetical protein